LSLNKNFFKRHPEFISGSRLINYLENLI